MHTTYATDHCLGMNSDAGVENKSKEGLLVSRGFICEELLSAELVESLEK